MSGVYLRGKVMKKDKKEQTVTEKMTDAELSKRLGGYQRVEFFCMLAVIVSVLGCVAAALFFQKLLLAAGLFGLAAAGILLGSGTQKKKKALMQEQLGDFFRAEYEKFFGPELCTEELCIDRTFLEKLHLLEEQCANGKLVNQYQYQEGKILSLALETDYDFAAVPGNVDLRDIEAVRQSYAASLRKMEQLLGFLVE